MKIIINVGQNLHISTYLHSYMNHFTFWFVSKFQIILNGFVIISYFGVEFVKLCVRVCAFVSHTTQL